MQNLHTLHVLPTAVQALPNTPHVSGLSDAFLQEAARHGICLSSLKPVSLHNQFAVLATLPPPVIDLTPDQFVTPSKGPTALTVSTLHTAMIPYPYPALQGLPVLTPSPAGKDSVMFPTSGISSYKNLSYLPKFQCWDPSNLTQLPTPGKWIARLVNHCFLFEDWHLPSVMPYFFRGSAVDWYEQLVMACQIKSSILPHNECRKSSCNIITHPCSLTQRLHATSSLA